MYFTSFSFIVFVIVSCLIYHIFPVKFRYLVIAFASTVFYYSLSKWMIMLLLAVTLITYLGGLFSEKKHITKITWVMLCGILLFFKYINVFKIISQEIVEKYSGSIPEGFLLLAMPLGLSFYIFEAVSYVADCKKRAIIPEKNILFVYTYLSFFVTVSSGPIERAGNLIPQLKQPKRINYDSFRRALLLILWGFLLKLVLANRLDVFVNTVYDNPEIFSGTIVRLATIFYTLEIYSDFAGYSCIAIGVGELFGINICENFSSPYLSPSIPEFWRRWHISLSSWLRDYIYIPLGGSRKGHVRKLINILIVFLISGIWHGASLTFVFWGLLHGVYQVISDLIAPIKKRTSMKAIENKNERLFSVMEVICTFFLVNFAWIFFRADSFSKAFTIIKECTHVSPWVIFDGSIFEVGLTRPDMIVVIITIAIMIFTDCMNYKKISIRDRILSLPLVLRWVLCIAAVVFVFICGVWGRGYDAANFIYTGF
ncbi:MAG: MBOAT family protein [Lachnospiraceae bacterium]|nr:MBOAT family protein [Lachnospiraceae bacterium]